MEYFTNTGHSAWNARLDFGMCNNWQYVNVSIWDHDFISSDDILMPPQTFSVNQGVYDLQHCDTVDCNRKISSSVSPGPSEANLKW